MKPSIAIVLSLLWFSVAAAQEPDVELPEEEIVGTLEKPDVFFVLPRARSRSEDQVLRSRIRREITKPLVKEWLEEGLLLEGGD